MTETIKLASTTPGKTWRISFVKFPGKPAYWSAMEGEETPGGGFRFIIGLPGESDRHWRNVIYGRATPKRKEEHLKALLDLMLGAGLITAESRKAAA